MQTTNVRGAGGIIPFACEVAALGLFLSMTAAVRAEESASTAFSFNDYLVAQLRVHLLTARDEEAFRTTLSEADISRIVTKVNGVWAQAGIHFHVESIVREEPDPLAPAPVSSSGDAPLLRRIPANSQDDRLFHVYYIKEFGPNGIFFPKAIFVKDSASLRPVRGGIDEPIPRVTAHELGHALGLPHRQNLTNLMASGTTGTSLNEAEIQRVRESAARSKRFLRAAELLIDADTLHASGRGQEARTLYEQLSKLAMGIDGLLRVSERATATAR